MRDVDASIFRDITIYERTKLQIRGDAINVFNIFNPSNPGLTLNSASHCRPHHQWRDTGKSWRRACDPDRWTRPLVNPFRTSFPTPPGLHARWVTS